VESAPGRGAVFWFEADFEALDQAPPARPLAGLTIGVASPSPIVREAAARQIEASGGAAALAPAPKGLPRDIDLVLIDGALRRARPPQATPALILLAPEERRRIVASKTAGFAGYLIKPLRRESVSGRILAVLASVPAPMAGGERAAEDERAVSAPARGVRVLLVEDNPVNALLAQALLGREGCSVDRAATGAEALDAAAQAPYDLILMDLRMPDMDGLSAARAIRMRGTSTPIVALTANSFEEDRHACLAAGMDDFLTKPLSPAALRAALHRWAPVRTPTPTVPPQAAVL
jgi:CheY-like chemotaxis protein